MKRKTILYIVVCVLLIGTGLLYNIYSDIYVSNVIKDGVLYINKDDNKSTILKKLYDKAIVKDTSSISWLMNKKNYYRVRTGKYDITKGMNNNDLVNKLRSGDQDAIKLTFNNIRTKEEFAGRVSKVLMLDSLPLLNKLNDDQFTERFGFNHFTIIGMFLPNTYDVYWDISIDGFFKRMYKEYNSFWTISRIKKAKSANISPMGAIIIASIVEEESIMVDEAPIIAGVYINRLNKNYTLGADPTLKFALGDFKIKRILNIHKEIDSPYNTYKYGGLPPGPIRQPSTRTIDHVLNYKKHKYLYFCAKEDFSGYHNFAKTLTQHNINAAKYRKELNRRKIYK